VWALTHRFIDVVAQPRLFFIPLNRFGVVRARRRPKRPFGRARACSAIRVVTGDQNRPADPPGEPEDGPRNAERGWVSAGELVQHLTQPLGKPEQQPLQPAYPAQMST